MEHETWRTKRLHHWSMLALLFGSEAPAPVDENLPGMEVERRLARIAEILGLSSANPERVILGPAKTTAKLNFRLIEKMRGKEYAKRAPIVSWAPSAVENAAEIWRQSIAPANGGTPELRTYFFAPLSFAEQNECYLSISGEDGQLFNIIRCTARYANNIRAGELIYARQVSECVDTCCKQYLELRTELVKANAEVLELSQRNRKLNERLGRLGAE
jgi:hypothetical protein